MAIDRAELRRGLAETKRYLLSHHPPSEYDRCYAPVVFGRRIRLCARCSGVYPGIVGGLAAGLGLDGVLTGLLLVVCLPLPALVNWTLTAFTHRRGSNPVRTVTGALLGYAYGLGLVRLLAGGDWRVLAVGLGYGLVAGLLLARRKRGASG